ncbi:hypothetical protein L226DRAFT_572856 [Lentinus tigrinus ALCF2SS1-7]|uniref:DUF6533 domain-containing protein n=1 Tax=Lentinus tigrinus ALCF2SS1-6 TaxID=1328759 RepID=A0A5C2S4N5_9APHY|nr:hypothetical protein L227DRAFT_612726 [Lentinus tigrinus ALCF2SS1-6]RPD72740.1 hypothetical protein L226DRAFT_572856 [Lentinus tigrinus ALCF2SS1-7]
MSSENASDLVLYIESNLPIQLCTLSVAALLVYDLFLTLDTELAVFWRHRPALASILYFINRYLQILRFISSAILEFPVTDQTYVAPPGSRWSLVVMTAGALMFRSCASLSIFWNICLILPYLAWGVFSGFRAYALTNRNICLATLVFFLNVTFVGPDVYQFSVSKNINLPPPYSCSTAIPPGAVLKPRIPLLLNVLTLALNIKSYDGSLIYLIMGECIVFFRDAITSILISRFLLDLGMVRIQAGSAVGHDDSVSEYCPSEFSYVTFAVPELDDSVGAVETE